MVQDPMWENIKHCENYTVLASFGGSRNNLHSGSTGRIKWYTTTGMATCTLHTIFQMGYFARLTFPITDC